MTLGLAAAFEKAYRGGPTIRAAVCVPDGAGLVTVLFGPSGSGKTTVLRCLAGLERPDRGCVRFGGDTWSDAERGTWVPPQRRGVGYLSQDYALFPHLTVAQNVAYGLGDLPRAERNRRVRELTDMLRLCGLEARYPRQLSGGEQQRVALARALARRPRLLLLDEPLSALDGPTREPLRGDLRRWLTALRVPTVLVTHDGVEARALGDAVVVLHEGQVRQSGPVEDVFARPADVEVARIVGVETVQAARVVSVAGKRAEVAVGAVRLIAVSANHPGGEAFVCIRAEDVTLAKGDVLPAGTGNRLSGSVTMLLREGPLVRVGVNCGFPLLALVTAQTSREMDLREGDRVTAAVRAEDVRLIPRSAEAGPRRASPPAQ
jgi:molybdate transport system ATP-binding protein